MKSSMTAAGIMALAIGIFPASLKASCTDVKEEKPAVHRHNHNERQYCNEQSANQRDRPQGDALEKAAVLNGCDNLLRQHRLGCRAEACGVHGIIIPKRRSVGLTATVAKTSAGALNYTPVAKVTNLVNTMKELKKKGLWFVCADMGGRLMYDMNMTGPIGLVIGNEGEGVSRLVRENCDFTAAVPMKGEIDSLNASVAAGVLCYEVARQRSGLPACAHAVA